MSTSYLQECRYFSIKNKTTALAMQNKNPYKTDLKCQEPGIRACTSHKSNGEMNFTISYKSIKKLVTL